MSAGTPQPRGVFTTADRDALREAVIRGQYRGSHYSSQRITSLRGGASEKELAEWRAQFPHRPESEFIDAELDAVLAAISDRIERVPPVSPTPPTSEQVREALYTAVHHRYPVEAGGPGERIWGVLTKAVMELLHGPGPCLVPACGCDGTAHP